MLRDSALASQLEPDLYAILLNTDKNAFTFSERHDAGQALISLDSPSRDWGTVINELVELGDEDSTRLALELMGDVGFQKFSGRVIAHAMLAHLGLLHNIDADEAEHAGTGVLYALARHLPVEQIADVLNELASHLRANRADLKNRIRSELANAIARLIARHLEVGSPEPLAVLEWLRTVCTTSILVIGMMKTP